MRSLAHAGCSVLQSRPNGPTDKTNKRQTKRAPFPLRDLLQAPRNRDTLSFGGTGISLQYVQGSSHAKNQLDSFSRFDSTPTCGRQTRTQDHSIFGAGIASHDKKWKLRVETFMYVTSSRGDCCHYYTFRYFIYFCLPEWIIPDLSARWL